MNKISLKEFQFRQPSYPAENTTDAYYLNVANSLFSKYQEANFFKNIPENLAQRIAINITGYFQDIVCDAGIWRSFINFNRTNYTQSIPFHEEGENYVDYELNREDVRFLVWYNLAMLSEEHRNLYPHNPDVLGLADLWYDYLESIYDDAPTPEEYNLAMGLEFHDPEDQEKIYHLGNWLFLHCYLLTPAFALTMQEILSDTNLLENKDITALQTRIEQAMMELPTGPVALFIVEWLKLLINGEIPSEKIESDKEHPYYRKFMDAVGREIKYFGSYDELNKFLINDLGWKENEEHLSVLKNAENIILLVNKEKGMLAARNVAKCIADPENPYYDKEYAKNNDFRLLTERGKCPVDLIKFACKNSWLPDAVFPGTDDHEIIKLNWDFIARCYLQQYYRD